MGGGENGREAVEGVNTQLIHELTEGLQGH